MHCIGRSHCLLNGSDFSRPRRRRLLRSSLRSAEASRRPCRTPVATVSLSVCESSFFLESRVQSQMPDSLAQSRHAAHNGYMSMGMPHFLAGCSVSSIQPSLRRFEEDNDGILSKILSCSLPRALSSQVHLFVQLMEWRVGDNPRGQWTYGDEDLVGTMVEVSKSCPPSTLAPVPSTKWLHLALHED